MMLRNRLWWAAGLLFIALGGAVAVAVILIAYNDNGGGPSGADSLACGKEGGNLFQNPGFEEGDDPWISLDSPNWGPPFTVSNRQAHSGQNSALLEMRPDPSLDIKVFGVLQDVTPAKLPEVISGYYYVERWEQGTKIQYLQFAVIVDQAANRPVITFEGTPSPNHQIRYPLTEGGNELAAEVLNAAYFKFNAPVRVGQWTYFERNLCDDFQAAWQDVPEDFAKLRFFFEARYEGRRPEEGPAIADVYYDDLYIGPAAGNPNRPDDVTGLPTPTP